MKRKIGSEGKTGWGRDKYTYIICKEDFSDFFIILSLCALLTLLIHSTSQSSSEGCGVWGGGGLVGAGTGRLGKLNT